MITDIQLIIGVRKFGMSRKSEFKIYKECRFCKSKNIESVIDLGKMPLAGGFIKNKSSFKLEKKYALSLQFCRDCYLLQTSISINPEILFKKYFYFSSSINTLIKHFENTAREVKKMLPRNSFIVEIGCNDGMFIKALENNNFKALGIDPATNIVKPLINKGAPIINDFFTDILARKITKKYGAADAIYSFHSLAHIPDMHSVVSGI